MGWFGRTTGAGSIPLSLPVWIISGPDAFGSGTPPSRRRHILVQFLRMPLEDDLVIVASGISDRIGGRDRDVRSEVVRIALAESRKRVNELAYPRSRHDLASDRVHCRERAVGIVGIGAEVAGGAVGVSARGCATGSAPSAARSPLAAARSAAAGRMAGVTACFTMYSGVSACATRTRGTCSGASAA